MNETEYSLLLRSHDPTRVRELLSQRYSLHGEQKPILVLHDQKGDKTAVHSVGRSKSRRANLRGKSKANRDLADFLKAGIPSYKTYEPLNILWKSYFKDTGKDANRLLTADWNGAHLGVLASRNPAQVGLQGLILWEGRNYILIVTPANEFKQLPKAGCLFEIEGYRILGDRVRVRSAERTTRKFKPHGVSDITDVLGLFFQKE